MKTQLLKDWNILDKYLEKLGLILISQHWCLNKIYSSDQRDKNLYLLKLHKLLHQNQTENNYFLSLFLISNKQVY